MAKISTPVGKRNEVLSRSLPLFSKRGFLGLTLSDLSREIGVSKPAIFYHFKEPQDIFLSLMEEWAASGTRYTVEYLNQFLGREPLDLVVAILEATFYWLDKDNKFAELTLAVFLAAQDDERVEKKLDQLFSGGRIRIMSLLRLSRKMKNKDDKQLEEIAYQLHSLIVGGLVYDLILKGKKRSSYRANYIDQFRKTAAQYF